MITFLPAKCFTKGREAKIDTIVVHWMAGTLASTDATFTGGAREASAHYGVENGTVHQYVHDYDTAWHAGDRPTNHRSIGIEHSAGPGRDATPETIATSVALMVTLCREYGISPDRIYPHNRFFNTQCPGTLPLVAMIAAVRVGLGGTRTAPPAASRGTTRAPITGKLVVDGVFGPATIRCLQQWAGATADGKLGPLSWAAIQHRVGATPDGRPGPNTWRAIQRLVGSIQDGAPGPNTYAALQRFLNSH